MKIQTFIFNWPGVKEGKTHYEMVTKKEEQFKLLKKDPIIINSDEEHNQTRWHNIGNDGYFTAQYFEWSPTKNVLSIVELILQSLSKD